jgi:hypothetical protein
MFQIKEDEMKDYQQEISDQILFFCVLLIKLGSSKMTIEGFVTG